MENNVKQALEKTWTKAQVEKITEIDDIMTYWVMWTPWLVIDEKVVSFGKVNTIDEIIEIIKWNKENDWLEKTCCCN